MTTVDQDTGEVRDEVALVPLHIAELDENELLAMFPTPVQAAGALLIARERLANAPAALERLSSDVKAAKRRLAVARGTAFVERRREGATIADARARAEIDDRVSAASDAVDTAELALEYGRDLRKAISEDIDILRSINSNLRQEHS